MIVLGYAKVAMTSPGICGLIVRRVGRPLVLLKFLIKGWAGQAYRYIRSIVTVNLENGTNVPLVWRDELPSKDGRPESWADNNTCLAVANTPELVMKKPVPMCRYV